MDVDVCKILTSFIPVLYDIELIDFTDTMGLDEYYSLSAVSIHCYLCKCFACIE